MRRIVLVFGLIAGAIMSAMLAGTVLFPGEVDFDRSALVGYASMVLAFLMVYVGVRTYRDTVAGGRIGFGRALGVGLLITLVATSCYVATWEILYFKVVPDFGEKFGAYVVDQARRSGAPDSVIAARRAEMDEFARKYRHPVYNALVTFREPLPVGLLFSLVTAGIVSRRRTGAAGAAPATT